jgi:hypothetical protein
MALGPACGGCHHIGQFGVGGGGGGHGSGVTRQWRHSAGTAWPTPVWTRLGRGHIGARGLCSARATASLEHAAGARRERWLGHPSAGMAQTPSVGVVWPYRGRDSVRSAEGAAQRHSAAAAWAWPVPKKTAQRGWFLGVTTSSRPGAGAVGPRRGPLGALLGGSGARHRHPKTAVAGAGGCTWLRRLGFGKP